MAVLVFSIGLTIQTCVGTKMVPSMSHEENSHDDSCYVLYAALRCLTVRHGKKTINKNATHTVPRMCVRGAARGVNRNDGLSLLGLNLLVSAERDSLSVDECCC